MTTEKYNNDSHSYQSSYLTKECHQIQEGQLYRTMIILFISSSFDTIVTPLIQHDLSRKTKRKANCFILVQLLLIIIVLLMALTLLLTARIGLQLSPMAESLIVLTENTTILMNIYNITKHENAVVHVNEKALDGDAYHINHYTIVPYSKVVIHRELSRENHSVLPISNNAVALNQRYIYMLIDSLLTFNICLSGAQQSSNTKLYGFNTEKSYKDYIRDLSLETSESIYSADFKIGSHGNILCSTATYTATNNGYYFFVLKTKYANTELDYTIKAVLNRLAIRDYLEDGTYSTCRVDESKPSCTLNVGSGQWALIGASDMNYDFGSRLNHVQVNVTRNRDHVMSIVYDWSYYGGIGLFCGAMLYTAVLVVTNLIGRLYDRKRRFGIVNYY